MIGYVTMGTNDLVRAAKFYDALFARARRQTHAGVRALHLVVGRSGRSRHRCHQAARRQSGDARQRRDGGARRRFAREGEGRLRPSHEARCERRGRARAYAGEHSTRPTSAISMATSSTCSTFPVEPIPIRGGGNFAAA